MTKPTDGALKAYRALRDAPPLDIDAIGRIIDREAVAPAVRAAVADILDAITYEDGNARHTSYQDWVDLNQYLRPVLAKHHLIEESDQ